MKKFLNLLLMLSALSFFSTQAMAESYPEKVGEKLGFGLANIGTGFIEIPKTVIVNSQKQGPLYGTTAGLFKGFWFAVCRTGFGIVDVVTFPFLTEPFTTPKVIWKDFDKETTFR